MALSRKHFETLAEVVRDRVPASGLTRVQLADILADWAASHSERFDRARFLANAGEPLEDTHLRAEE